MKGIWKEEHFPGKKNTFQERRTFSRKEERLSRKKSSYENGRALFWNVERIQERRNTLGELDRVPGTDELSPGTENGFRK
jgi:hypothetical protein